MLQGVVRSELSERDAAFIARRDMFFLATVDAAGRVTDARVLRGIPILDQAALDAVKQWVYTPTLLNGVPTPILMTVTVTFQLRQS